MEKTRLKRLHVALVLLGALSIAHADAIEYPADQEPGAMLRRCEVALYADRFEETLNIGSECIQLHGETGPVLRLMAVAAYRLKRYDVTAFYADKLLRQTPDHAEAISYKAWSKYFLGLTDEAAGLFQRLLELAPEYPFAANGLGWSLLARGDRTGAEAAFRQTLARNPADVDAQQGLEQCVGPEQAAAFQMPQAAPGPLPASPWWQGAYLTLSPYVSRLVYGGASQKTDGQSLEINLRLGLYGKGFIDLETVDTAIAHRLGPFEQSEIKVGLGVFPRSDVLVRLKVSHLDTDMGAERSADAWGTGLYLRQGARLQPTLEGLIGNYPVAESYRVSPGLALKLGAWFLHTAVDLQRLLVDGQDARNLVYVHEDASVTLAPGSVLSLHLGLGESRFDASGLGDVFYNLVDKHKASAWLRYDRSWGRWSAGFKTAWNLFENIEGADYHSLAHTFTLAYAWQPGVAQPLARSATPWTFSAGADIRRVRTTLHAEPLEPYLHWEQPVAVYHAGEKSLYRGGRNPTVYQDGSVFSDPLSSDVGAAYFEVSSPTQIKPLPGYYDRVDFRSRRWTYWIENQFDPFDAEQTERLAAPYVELRRDLGIGFYNGKLGLAGRYAYSGIERAGGWRDVAIEQVMEKEAVYTYSYPVAADYWVLYDPTAFQIRYPVEHYPWLENAPAPSRSVDAQTRVYETYQARSCLDLHADCHEAFLALDWQYAPAPAWSVSLAAGPFAGLTDWSLMRRTEWRKDNEVLAELEDVDHGLAFSWGLDARLAVRCWLGKARSGYVELHGGGRWADEVELTADFGQAKLEADTAYFGAAAGWGL